MRDNVNKKKKNSNLGTIFSIVVFYRTHEMDALVHLLSWIYVT